MAKLRMTLLSGGGVFMSGNCMFCSETVSCRTTAGQVEAWRQGVPIQKAMPELSDGQREFLISGICEKCFDGITEEEE